jgi:iron complex transport system permease protein
VLARSLTSQIIVLAVLAAALAIVCVGSLGLGAVSISWGDICAILTGSAEERGVDTAAASIVLRVRLPRIVLALLVGGALAVSGMAMQGLFQNPLADPYIVGVAPGAAMGATLAVALGWDVAVGTLLAAATGWDAVWFGAYARSIVAFAGSLVVSFLVYALASRFGRTPVLHLLLFGVALGALCMGITSFILLISPHQLQEVYFWLLGSFQDARWTKVHMVWPYMVVAVPVLFFLARDMDGLLLGEDEAQSLGIAVERLKKVLLAVATLLAAVAVAVSGVIGFVGLIVPHMMRVLVGPRHRILLPASLLGGSVILVLSDTLARSIRPGTEIPVGIITTFLGVPFFLFLLSRKPRYLR